MDAVRRASKWACGDGVLFQDPGLPGARRAPPGGGIEGLIRSPDPPGARRAHPEDGITDLLLRSFGCCASSPSLEKESMFEGT